MNKIQMEKMIREWNETKSNMSVKENLFENKKDIWTMQLMQLEQLKRIADSLENIELRIRYRW